MRPNTKGLRPITVRMTAVAKAIAKANAISSDWQAELCEIALLPNVYKRWRQINGDRYTLARIDGLPHIHHSREQNLAIGQSETWDRYAGYVLGPSWNSVRPDWFSHGPSCAWNGMRRDTYSRFILDIHQTHCVYARGSTLARRSEYLDTYKVRIVNDLD